MQPQSLFWRPASCLRAQRAKYTPRMLRFSQRGAPSLVGFLPARRFFVCCPAPRQPPSFSCSGSQSAMRHGGVQSPVKQPFRRYGVNTVQEAARLPPCAPRQKTRRRQRRQYPRQGLAVGRVERTHASYSQPSSAVVSAVVNGLTPLTEYDLHTASYWPCVKQARPHNTPAASSGKIMPWFRRFFLPYTKYACEKLPSSGPDFSRNLLLPYYAVLPQTETVMQARARKPAALRLLGFGRVGFREKRSGNGSRCQWVNYACSPRWRYQANIYCW
jgi:hypothetical protein